VTEIIADSVTTVTATKRDAKKEKKGNRYSSRNTSQQQTASEKEKRSLFADQYFSVASRSDLTATPVTTAGHRQVLRGTAQPRR